jgi:hypothetical protein
MSVKRHVKVTKARKAAVSRRVASALAGFLRKMNPGTKAAGAKVQRLKGGVLKITPIKANAAGGNWDIEQKVGVRNWRGMATVRAASGREALKIYRRDIDPRVSGKLRAVKR